MPIIKPRKKEKREREKAKEKENERERERVWRRCPELFGSLLNACRCLHHAVIDSVSLVRSFLRATRLLSNIFNVPASCLPSPKLTPRPAKVEDQQLRYFLQKDKITSFDTLSERHLQKQYKNLIISRLKERLVCLFMTDNFSECSLSVIVENKPTLCSPPTLSAFKNGISTTV
ncbi:hypothetical protein FHG87_000280 [Trinorchestia longiramus]|nr:hypothetical protein FHG87_000280 [Trinorchestia longiramus]